MPSLNFRLKKLRYLSRIPQRFYYFREIFVFVYFLGTFSPFFTLFPSKSETLYIVTDNFLYVLKISLLIYFSEDISPFSRRKQSEEMFRWNFV